MRSIYLAIGLTLAFLWSTQSRGANRTTTPSKQPIYSPVADDVYLQETAQKVPTDAPVTALAACEGKIYAIVGGCLHQLRDAKLRAVEGAPPGLHRLFALDGALWGSTADALYHFEDGARSSTRVLNTSIVGMCLHNGAIHAATSDEIYRFTDGSFVNIKPNGGWLSSDSTMVMEDGSQVLAEPVHLGPIEHIASYSGTLYLLGPGGLALLDGDVFVNEPVDWGMMPSSEHRDLLARGSRLLISTDRGIAMLRGAALTTVTGKDGLPYEDTTCLAEGFRDDLWIGTSAGAIRHTGKEYHYFGADHWLPGENVHDIAVNEKSVYIATDRGIGILHYEPYTLLKKAAYFEQALDTWGHKRLGFVHKLYWSGGENGKWQREISDNDGGHTAHYLAAMSFKYAVTRDEAARREALEALQAMMWLQSITGTDGFFARAIWAVDVDPGQRSTEGSGGLPAKWVAADDGKWMWKGDTSSDEVNAHFYAVALFHDLVANDAEKEFAAQHLARIAKHIIDNGWVLRDVDGQPTRWGRWDPEYLLRPYGFEARGLNGMEAQTYMWTALKLTSNPAFQKGLDQLLAWRYDTYTVREKLTFPPDSVVPWDDELAFRCFHPLITYCDEPRLRSIYLRALERHWEVLRMQKIPFFNFIYGGLTGNDCEAEEAVRHLREWSLDTVSHNYRNSHRSDLATEPGYTPYMGGTRAISPRELAATWGSRSSIQYDGGSHGRTVTPPVGWLEDYWMGRYYGMIQPPTSDASELTSVPPREMELVGAAPYDGPPRPPQLSAN